METCRDEQFCVFGLIFRGNTDFPAEISQKILPRRLFCSEGKPGRCFFGKPFQSFLDYSPLGQDREENARGQERNGYAGKYDDKQNLHGAPQILMFIIFLMTRNPIICIPAAPARIYWPGFSFVRTSS